MIPIRHNSTSTITGWIVLAAIVGMLMWSCRTFVDFGGLVWELRGKSLVERGSIGASEWQSFLARSARVEQQNTFAKLHREIDQASHGGQMAVRVIFSDHGIIVALSENDLPSKNLAENSSVFVRSEKEFASDVENNWRFAAEQATTLPVEAKIFLNEQSFSLYLVSTFFFFPRRVDVDLTRAEIRNDETFDAAFQNALDRTDLSALETKLRALGYSHLITRENGALKMRSLREFTAANSRW